MKEMAYFELFGRISDRFVTEALIPAVVPVPAPQKGFKQTPLGKFLTGPAFIATVSVLAAAAVAIAIGFGLAGRDDTPNAPDGSAFESGLTDSREDSLDTEHMEGDATREESDSETENSTERTDDSGEHPYIARKDYNGQGFGIIYGKNLMGEGFSYLPEDMVFAGATALNADLYERIQMTEDYLGVSIGLWEQEDEEALMHNVGLMSGASENDNYLIVASGQSMSRLGSFELFLTPWESLEAINTKADYWDTALMTTHTQGGHSYIAYSSFIPPNAYAIAYNKSLYATAPTQRDLYDLVESGDWTVETLMAVLGETAPINGRLSTHDNASVSAYLSAMGFSVLGTVETDTGYTQSFNIADRQESMKPLFLRAMELISSDFVLRESLENGSETPFIEQGEVLMDTRLTRELAYRAYGKSFGVLPLPKYDKAQSEYLSVHANAYMGLWCGEENRQMCGEVAELLAYFSRNSHEDYNRAVMGVYGKDDSGVQRDLAMLRIIHDTTHDMGMSYVSQWIVPGLREGRSESTSSETSMIRSALRTARKATGW